MRILIATTQVPFISGGAEVLAKTLLQACISRGHEAEIVAIPFKHYPAVRILDHMLACRLLDVTEVAEQKVDKLIGLKFPAYLIPHPNKSFWLLHQHRAAYEFWGNSALSDLMHTHDGSVIHDAIVNADQKNFREHSNSIFTISKNVTKRLKKFNSFDSRPLYPPPQDADRFYSDQEEGYLFFPSRLNLFKRQRLVIQALSKTKNPVRIVFGGRADEKTFESELESLTKKLGVDNRVTFLGSMTEEQKLKYYAKATGVIYTPLDEDYGYVTLEAMLSSKPVITCSDAGGPLEFIKHQETGLVAESDPDSLAAAMDELWENRGLSEKLGKTGRDLYHTLDINWDNVLKHLLQ
jgi:glycosyltransferase involved in cell wall biosynthesis